VILIKFLNWVPATGIQH